MIYTGIVVGTVRRFLIKTVLYAKRLINRLWLHLQLVYRTSLIKWRTDHVGILELTKKELLVPLSNVLEVVTHWHMHCRFAITDLSSIILKQSPSNVAVKGTFTFTGVKSSNKLSIKKKWNGEEVSFPGKIGKSISSDQDAWLR